MRPVALSDQIAVGEMPSLDEITVLAKAGFRSLINAQPDGELARHLSADAIADAAARAGMTTVHIPIESRRPSEDRIQAFASALATLPLPAYACCYSGARAAAGWALAAAPTMRVEDIVASCTSAGYDMAFFLPELARRHAAAAVRPGPTAAQPIAAQPESSTAIASWQAKSPPPDLPRPASAGGFAVSG